MFEWAQGEPRESSETPRESSGMPREIPREAKEVPGQAMSAPFKTKKRESAGEVVQMELQSFQEGRTCREGSTKSKLSWIILMRKKPQNARGLLEK